MASKIGVYVECRKKFSVLESWVSVCFSWSVRISYGVAESVFACFACASMLVSVTFSIGMRGD
jgi:hypothetical protein